MRKSFNSTLVVLSWLVVWAGLCTGGMVGAALIATPFLISFWLVMATGMTRDEKFCAIVLWCSGCFSCILAFGDASRIVVMLFVTLFAGFACSVMDSNGDKSRKAALS